jgi:integrase
MTRKWTVAEYLTRWLDTLDVTDLKESTKESYRRNAKKHVIPRIGHVRLQQLAPDDLSGLYGELLNSGLSRRTVHYIHTILGKALRAGVDAGHLIRNPAEKATRPQRKSDRGHKGRTWNELELRTFLAHVAEDPFYPAFLLAATTGMRRGEVLGLTWRDVDFEQGRVLVNRQLVAISYMLRFEDSTKTGQGRVVDLDDWTVAALRTHRARQKGLRLALGIRALRLDDLVFVAVDKQAGLKPLHPETLAKTFKRRARRAGVPVIRFHDLRHTWASLALRGGESPKVVQERLGHRSIQITLDIYSHVTPGMQKSAANNVAARVFGTS